MNRESVTTTDNGYSFIDMSDEKILEDSCVNIPRVSRLDGILISVHVDTTELDRAIDKARELRSILEYYNVGYKEVR